MGEAHADKNPATLSRLPKRVKVWSTAFTRNASSVARLPRAPQGALPAMHDWIHTSFFNLAMAACLDCLQERGFLMEGGPLEKVDEHGQVD